jgi:anti-sigma regulatory factor (Ser/Thr protein kinase)
MKEITVEARGENVRVLTDWADAELEQLACPMKAQMQIDLAIDEIFTNIASYAYAPGTGDATVRMDYDAGSGMFSLTFSDSGVPYNPLQKEDPDVNLPAEERSIGGLGIFLVKKTMDDMRYEYRDGRNVLTLMKKIS